jgi:transcriptional regulator with XRE-family HTH domain
LISINKPINFLLPEDFARQLGELARERRLASNLTRETLAARSGVPSPTIRKFETTGAISLIGLLRLADGLDCMDDFNALFPRKSALTIEEFVSPKRIRGRK